MNILTIKTTTKDLLTKLIMYLYNKSFFMIGRIRALFWGMFFKYLGKNTTIAHSFIASSPHLISIGDNTNIGIRCIFGAHGNGSIEIGNNVAIAPDVTILASNHNYDKVGTPIKSQETTCKPVKIENGAWIATKVVILAGVTVGKGSVVGAGSVVTKDVPAYTVVGGVPAKIIKKIA